MDEIQQPIATKGDDMTRTPSIPPDGTPAPSHERLRQVLATGGDETNPEFLFSTTHTTLLLAIEAGLIDPVGLARAELAGRGLDADGTWCGFAGAREIHLGAVAADVAEHEVDAVAEQTAVEIARRILHIDTLDTRNSDALDFHTVSVWQVKEAIESAFSAGQAAAR
jgi:hypothetical protein